MKKRNLNAKFRKRQKLRDQETLLIEAKVTHLKGAPRKQVQKLMKLTSMLKCTGKTHWHFSKKL
jgi:hypothetical protein